MPGTQDQDTVKPLSYTPIGKDDGTKPGIPPIPALRTSTPKQASLEGAENFTSDTLSPTASLGLGGSSDNGSEEHAYAELNLPLSEESVHSGSGEPIYAVINPSNKTPKESWGSGISSGMKRSVSQGTEFSDPWDSDKTLENLKEEFSTEYSTGEMNSKTSLINS